jgi:uncharacterized repeat protein (TIGR01451 family)
MFRSRSGRRVPSRRPSQALGSWRWRRLERLEDRAVPATIYWSTAAGSPASWLNPANWVGGVVPGPADDAVFPTAAYPPNVTLAGTAAVHSVDARYASLTVTSGSLTIGTGLSRFGPSVILNGGSLVPLDGATIVGGYLGNQGTTPFTIPAGVTLGLQNMTVNGRVDNYGTLNVSGPVQMTGNGITDNNSGAINIAAGATLSLNLSGSGLTFYNSGSVTVAAGGSLAASSAQYFQYTYSTTTVDGTMSGTVHSGVLAGTGTITGFTPSAVLVSPGHPGGALTLNGSYYAFGLAIALNGPAAGSQSRLRVNGDVVLGGGLSAGHLSLTAGYVAAPGDTFVIVDNGGTNPVSGQFFGLPEGATLTADNQPFSISYTGGNGNDVTLTKLPSANDAVWDGAPDGGGASADANWATASNWVGDIVPAAGADLFFPAAAAQKVNVNTLPAGTAFHSITFTGSGYDVSGNSIALAGGLRDAAAAGNNRFDPDITLTASQTFSVTTAGETLSLGGAISGAASVSLAKESAGGVSINAGTLRFDGTPDNTFAGTLIVNGGTLELDKTGAVAVAGPLVIGDGVGSDAVTELAADQVGDSAAVTVNAGATLSVAFGDTIGGLTINAGGTVMTGGSTLTVSGATTLNGVATADTLTVAGTSPFSATFDGAAIGPINTSGGVTFDGGGGTDTLVGPDADTTWTVNGPNAGALGGPVPVAFVNVENLTGGASADTFSFTAAGSVDGTIDGGGGTNALDYSAVTTAILADLGLDIAATAGWSAPLNVYADQDNGSATFTYRVGTNTFDISANARQQSSIQSPFTLRAPNGQTIDLLTLPGATYHLTYNGMGRPFIFTYSATNVSLPPAFASAFFGNQLTLTYDGFSSPVSWSGDSTTATGSAIGIAAGTGGVRNVTNVTGGAGDDLILGNFADNTLAGGAGNDTLLGGDGNDTLLGGAGNDTLDGCAGADSLLGGDGKDILNGGAGVDTLLGGAGDDTLTGGPGVDILMGGDGNDQFVETTADGSETIEGGPGVDSVSVGNSDSTVGQMQVLPGVGGRLAVSWDGATPAALDVGGVESASFGAGAGSADMVFTVADLAGVADLTAVTVAGNSPSNVFHVTPSVNVAVTVYGDNSMVPQVYFGSTTVFYFPRHGGALTVDTTGTTDPALQASSVTYQNGLFSSSTYLAGGYTFADRQPVNFTYLSSLAPVVSDASIVTTGGGNAVAGGPVTYTIVVSNANPSLPTGLPEVGVAVDDVFPATLTGVTYAAVGSGGADGFTASGSGDIHDTVNLPVGGTITYTVTDMLAPTATGTLSNTATVTVPATAVDTNPANNSSTDTRPIIPSADLSVMNSASVPTVFAGDTVTYTVAVNLQGELDAPNVTLNDTLPAGTTFVSLAYPAGWTPTTPPVGTTGPVTATLATLAQGSGPQVFTLVVRVEPATAGTLLTNTASVGSTAVDPDPTNNAADARTEVDIHHRPTVVGSGPGGTPRVTVYDQPTGTVRFSFLAFDASFAGGVRVAVGDVNGDGTPDIITGAGSGGGPHVKVFDGATGQPLPGPIGSFFAFDASFHGGVFVAAGDVNGDGLADVIVGAGAGGGPHVKVFSGADGSVLGSFYAYAPSFHGGVTVAAGDVTGDGVIDLVTGAGPGGGPHVKVFNGVVGPAIASYFAFDAEFHGGVSVAAGDLNGDGNADVVVGAGPGGGPHVKVFDGAGLARGGSAADTAIANPLASFYAYAPTFYGGISVAVVVRDGGGPLDLVTGAGPGGRPHVKEFDGLLAAELDGFYAFDPTFLGGVYVG